MLSDIAIWHEQSFVYVCARTEAAQQELERFAVAEANLIERLDQEADVLDTWFSSALWPISTMGWPHLYIWNLEINNEFFDRMDPGDKHRKPEGVRRHRQEILRMQLERTVEDELFKGKDHPDEPTHFSFEALDGGKVRVIVTEERVQAVFQKIAREFNRRLSGKEVMHKFELAATYVSQIAMESKPGLPQAPEATLLDTFYPTSVLSTAREILTLWVARMVIFGLYCKGDVPFRDVYIHAIIQDGDGRPMKKTLGNGVDPVDIVQSHGADALRFTLASMATETQDIRLPVQLVCPHCHERVVNNINGPVVVGCPKCKKQFTRPVQTAVGTAEAPMSHSTSDKFDIGRNFANKIWNASRFILSMPKDAGAGTSGVPLAQGELADRWIMSRLNATVAAVHKAINDYRFADYAEAVRTFFWTDLCDWYLEIAKARIKAQEVTVQNVLRHCLATSLQLLHPMMPFITEELWAHVAGNGTLLATQAFPLVHESLHDPAAETQMRLVQAVTSAIREIQNRYPAAKGKPVVLQPRDSATQALIEKSRGIIEPLTNAPIGENSPGAQKPENAAASVLAEVQIFIGGVIDKAAETVKLTKRRDELRKGIAADEGKLANEAFVSKAPAKIIDGLRDQLAKRKEELAAVERNLAELA